MAAIIAIGLEYTYRTMPAPWSSGPHFVLFMALQTVIGICIYKIVTTPHTSLIAAFIVWACATIVLRVIVTLILKDPVSPGTWAALALLVTARIVQHFWR
jgi:hypothetical protein